MDRHAVGGITDAKHLTGSTRLDKCQPGCNGPTVNDETQMTTNALEFLAEVWRQQPSLIVFLTLGLVVFVCLVVDSYRVQRRRNIRQRTGLY